MKALKTMMIKSRVYNIIRKELYGKQLDKITEKEKIGFFDNLFQLNNEAHWELNHLKRNRKFRAQIEALRKQRGYVRKKKTPIDQRNKLAS